ncbi:MAG: phenylacetic acid degradation protein [Sphingobium sp.]|uniref:PaaI family thioesterase n=1 Tax=Sphingobium sp. TaxID=1912891 RepID=UPI000DB4ADE7|nr:PaaI family thioesterase [Sphingobium sp.]PZU12141.1 MAG: phenylacetic acid degradation protein [Sphingobium sp.]
MRLPPYAERLQATLDLEKGRYRVVMVPGPHVTGRPGYLHGGAISGLLELAAFVALNEAIGDPGAIGIKPINVTVDFRKGGKLATTIARGEVIRIGRRIANVEATASQQGYEKPIAVARMNFLIDRRMEI